MKLQVKLLACGVGGFAAVTASACGSSSSSSAEPGAAALQSSMQTAVRQASSVHFDGQEPQNGVPVGVNMGVSRVGDLTGTISENKANLQVLKVDGKVYVKATPEFLTQVKAPASTCALVCGRWLELPPQEASQANQLTMDNVTGAVASPKLPKLTEHGSTTVNGQPAWVLRGPNGAVIDVSSKGTPYPLQSSGPGGHGVIKYSQWNAVPKPAAPPSSQIINMNGLH
jgi:hypothetical protein